MNELPHKDLAVVDREKITGYLLNTARMPGQAKARFFLAFGFTMESWEVMADALLEHGRVHAVARRKVSRFGKKFEIKGSLRTPDGRNPEIWTVWQLDNDALAPRLITAYPADK